MVLAFIVDSCQLELQPAKAAPSNYLSLKPSIQKKPLQHKGFDLKNPDHEELDTHTACPFGRKKAP